MPADVADTGSTDIDHALQQAYSTISGTMATNKRVVLITDGISAVAVDDRDAEQLPERQPQRRWTWWPGANTPTGCS